MTEIVFPILGAAFVLLVGLPACALLTKAVVWALERVDTRGPLHGLNLRYLALVGSSVFPLAWLLSAAGHQAETGRSVVACLFDHDAAARCFEPRLFIATLALALLALSSREIRAAVGVRASRSSDALETLGRMARIIATRTELQDLAGRVRVTEAHGYSLGTQGLLRPVVVVEHGYAQALSDDELASALGHEAEHVRARDPLRYFLLALALAVNPFGRRWLDIHASGWLGAREAHCDREAVIRGADPLPLADALLRAARPGLRPAAALGARDTLLLKLRVQMLLAFEEQRPVRCCHREPSSAPIVVALFMLTALLPHHTGTHALDLLHVGSEHALHFFWR